MKNAALIRLALIGAIAAATTPFAAQAGGPTPDPQAAPTTGTVARNTVEETGTQSLDEIVVTGNAVKGGVRKLDASYSITAADTEQIKEANAKSTADLLKIAPGLWPESSGGQTGANIEIAGFPGGGDAPFFTVQMMGSPLYGMPTLSFLEQSSMFRVDDTVERVEVIQGGPSVVFADGQMGASANFILKRGTATPKGSLGVTYGTEGLWRVDGFYGFQIADGWYASAGGFWRTSDGVRDPGYKADKGGQFTATLTHDLDNGSVMVYARVLDDKNQFITPVPLLQHGTDQFSAYPGFDPLKSTYYSPSIQHVFLAGYPGGGTNADLANGRGANIQFFGGNLDMDLGGGWTIADKFLIDGGDMDTNALFSGSNPASLTDELYNTSTGLGGFALPAGSATATYVGGGAVDPAQSVIHQGWWYIHKHLFSVNNDFRVSKELFQGNTLTAGVYLAYYTDDDKWALGNQMLMTNTPNARPITVSYVNGGQTYQLTDAQGFLDNGGYNITERGHATNKAFYLSDSWRIESWLFDASSRVENEKATNHVCNLSNVDTDSNPLTLYNNGVPVCNGTTATTDYDHTHVAWTVGANWELTKNMSLYGRANNGAHFGDFDNQLRGQVTGKTPPLTTIKNVEAGYKFQSKWLYADISVYRKQFDGLPYTPTDNQGHNIASTLIYGSDSKGLNLIGAITPFEHFELQMVGNYMDGHYTHYSACVPYVNVVTGNGCAVIEGKQLQRQPKVHYALTPKYTVPTPWADLTAFVTYTHVGPHTQDQSGLQQLGSYHTLDVGFVADVGTNWEMRVQGTNVTNELGLTESNSRIFGGAAGAGGVILARPLEGREVNFQVKYKF
jgi:outer membrane receptor protein involved in Fe transport